MPLVDLKVIKVNVNWIHEKVQLWCLNYEYNCREIKAIINMTGGSPVIEDFNQEIANQELAPLFQSKK